MLINTRVIDILGLFCYNIYMDSLHPKIFESIDQDEEHQHLIAGLSNLHRKEYNRMRTEGELAGTKFGFTKLYEDAERRAQAANIDPVTGLLNRRGLENSVNELLANSKHVGVIFLDADKFKRINDKLGHKAGDNLLKDIGDKLVGTLRKTDSEGFMVGRYGGDEFIAVVDLSFDESRAEREDAKPEWLPDQRLVAITTKIQNEFDEYAAGDPQLASVNFGISIGNAMWEPGISAEELIDRADQSMYAKKRLRDQMQQKDL